MEHERFITRTLRCTNDLWIDGKMAFLGVQRRVRGKGKSRCHERVGWSPKS